MSNSLPPGWARVRLDQITEPRSLRVLPIASPNAPYIGLEHVEAHTNRLIGTVPAASMSSSSSQFFAGDVLYGRMRPYLNKVLLPSFDGLASAEFIVLPQTDGVDNRFLLQRLSASDFVAFACSQYEGDRPRVKFDRLGKFEIDLPPLAEQGRIVAALDEVLSDLDAGVAELKAAQRKLTKYRQSLLKSAVEGSLTTEWRALRKSNRKAFETGPQLLKRVLRERRARWEAKQLTRFAAQDKTPPKGWRDLYQEPEEPDITDLPALPQHWTWASLDMLGEIASGVAKGTRRNPSTPVREVPYLRVANVQRGYLDLSEVKTILATPLDIEELTLQAGDVLFNEGGDRDKLGRGWVWRDEVAGCIHQNHVFRMRPYLPEMLPELISHHGNTFGKAWFQSAGKQTTNLASINMGMLRAFPVPVAPPDEQLELLARLESRAEALTAQEDAVSRGLKQAQAQRSNILRAAFSGQLVPQDPEDEPAGALLQRIRAKRAAEEKQPNPRKTRAAKEVATMVKRLIDVLSAAADWLPAQEAFRRCGVADGAQTDQIEALYAELRALDQSKRLAVEAVNDAKGRKLYDRLKLVPAV